MADLTRAGYEDVDQADELRLKTFNLLDPGTSIVLTDVTGFTVHGLPDTGGTITGVRASVSTQPTGATLIVDVNINGTTIYTTQGNRPTIAVSTNAATEAGAPEAAKVFNDNRVTVDVDQVGSTVSGAELKVSIDVRVDKPLDDD